MSDFTIEQLEALKEGTTPGPWKFREHPDYEYPAGPEWGPMQTELEHAVSDAEGNHLFGAYNNHKMIKHPGNVPLAAAAPALVDALIAEKQAHQKLRDEMGELVEYLSIQEGNDRLSRLYAHGQHSAMELIKDILEGE